MPRTGHRLTIERLERGAPLLLALSLFLAGVASGRNARQEAPPTEAAPPAIQVSSNLVLLHVTVLNKKGQFVPGLDKQDFKVYEDGQPQKIDLFYHEDAPAAIGLVIDNSGSMARKHTEVIEAALAFVHSSNPNDEVFIVKFNEHVALALPETTLTPANMPAIQKALDDMHSRGETALYDAIEMALPEVRSARPDKKVLIVLSDGGDNASVHDLKQVLQDVQKSAAVIYTIGLFDEYDNDRNPRVLREIARATGGQALFPTEIRQVVGMWKNIANDIRNQYTIGYSPENLTKTATYRTVHVDVTGNHGRKLMVRTRPGYTSSPNQPVAPQEGK